MVIKIKRMKLSAVLCAAVLTLTACAGNKKHSSSEVKSAVSSRKDNITSDYMPNVDSSDNVPANTAALDAKIDELSAKKIGWGQGTNTDELNRPVSCDEFNKRYGKYGGVFIGSKDAEKIYLTFDEGYENGYTEKILDVLKQKRVSAVFFVTKDYVKSNGDIVKRMIDEGHVVGNHTWSHPSMPSLTVKQTESEIQKLHEYVNESFGYKMTLFRPPMGEFSEKSLAVTARLGYKSVFWSFAYKDWDQNSQPRDETAMKKAVSSLHPGAIYLLHAVSKTNAEILGGFVDTARKQGYEFAKFDL